MTLGGAQLLPPHRYGSKREKRNNTVKPNAVATNTLAAEYNKSIDAYTSSRKSPTKKPKRTAAVESSSLFVQNLVTQSFAVTAKDITQRHENHMEAADNDDETPQVITSD